MAHIEVAIARQMVEERVEAASRAMERLPRIKEAYVELRKKGFHKGANAMRDMVYLFLIQKPDATEQEVISMIMESCNVIKTEKSK